jgi:hypothetical protein
MVLILICICINLSYPMELVINHAHINHVSKVMACFQKMSLCIDLSTLVIYNLVLFYYNTYLSFIYDII